MAATELTAEFVFERETKRTVRFAEVLADGQERGVIGTLYVSQDALRELFGDVPTEGSKLRVALTRTS